MHLGFFFFFWIYKEHILYFSQLYVRLKTIFVKNNYDVEVTFCNRNLFLIWKFFWKKDKRNNSYNLSYNRQTNNKIEKKIKIKITQYIFCWSNFLIIIVLIRYNFCTGIAMSFNKISDIFSIKYSPIC